MEELDEEKYFSNILEYDTLIKDNYNRQYLNTYKKIINTIKHISYFINEIKLFPATNILHYPHHYGGGKIYFRNVNVYTNYNFYFIITWIFTYGQYDTITWKDYEITFCFYDTFEKYTLNFNFDINGNIINMLSNGIIKNLEQIQNDLLTNYKFIKTTHPKLLLMYGCVMNLDESEEFYKKINSEYNLVSHIKQENKKTFELLELNYQTKLKYINDECIKYKEISERYIEELTNSQIIIDNQIMELEKYKKINDSLKRRINELLN